MRFPDKELTECNWRVQAAELFVAGLLVWFEQQTEFAFYASSLLLVYDNAAAAPELRVKMIDFAHVSSNTPSVRSVRHQELDERRPKRRQLPPVPIPLRSHLRHRELQHSQHRSVLSLAGAPAEGAVRCGLAGREAAAGERAGRLLHQRAQGPGTAAALGLIARAGPGARVNSDPPQCVKLTARRAQPISSARVHRRRRLRSRPLTWAITLLVEIGQSDPQATAVVVCQPTHGGRD